MEIKESMLPPLQNCKKKTFRKIFWIKGKRSKIGVKNCMQDDMEGLDYWKHIKYEKSI